MRLLLALAFALVIAAGATAAELDPSWEPLCGSVTLSDPEGGRMVLTTDDGTQPLIETDQVGAAAVSALPLNERVIVLGHRNPRTGRLTARFLQPEAAETEGAPQSWTCVRGYVLSLDDSAFTFRADGGEVRTIDLSAVPRETPRRFIRGERLVVIGLAGRGPDAPLSARFVRRDRTHGSR